MTIKHKLVSSLNKVFLDEQPCWLDYDKSSGLLGETVSFQWVLSPERGERLEAVIWQESDLKEHVRLYEIGHVPVQFPRYYHSDKYFLREGKPGLYPDPLYPLEEGHINLAGTQWRGVWVEITIPVDIAPGDYKIKMHMADRQNPSEVLATTEFVLEVIGAVIPKQKLIHTEWFHNDCIALYHNVEIFGEEHWDLIKAYMESAYRYGINMIYVPLFTPPLDTAVGGERPTTQLVAVSVVEGEYVFGFDKLKRYLDLARRVGMEYFEMSHLFTQWGAAHAPKVVATVDGEIKKIFGWETDSVSPEYTTFLRQFIPELKEFLTEEGILKASYFHISDEPALAALESYKGARDSISDLLEDCNVIDALSNIEFYNLGLITSPIPSIYHIEPFIEVGVPDLWAYYCCGETNQVSNRMIAMPGLRTRILGVQLYKHKITGFLQWGFNFYFLQHSKGLVNPYVTNDAGLAFPGGDPFIVYPGEDGPIPSLRQIVFYEGLQDIRALELLESLVGRERVEELIDEKLGEDFSFKVYPKGSDGLKSLRNEVNRIIGEYSGK